MCRKIRPKIGGRGCLGSSCVSDEVKVPLLCKYNDKKVLFSLVRNVTGRNKIMYNEKRDSYIMSCVYLITFSYIPYKDIDIEDHCCYEIQTDQN